MISFSETKRYMMNRSQAFELIRNMKLTSWLERTKMCPHLQKHGECRNKNCRYAHTKNELKLAACVFGTECIYKNSKTRPCTYIHPDETSDDFSRRTGLRETGSFQSVPITILTENSDTDIDILLERLKDECSIENNFYRRENSHLIRCTKDVLETRLGNAFQSGIRTITVSID